MSEARKHHIVPASYLRYWHSGSGKKAKLLVLDKTQGGELREQRASQVARIGDFYRLDNSAGLLVDGTDPLHIESALAEIERESAKAWHHLSAGGDLDVDTMKRVAMFMAVWAYRTPWSLDFFREALAQYQPKTPRDEAVQEWLRGPGTPAMLSLLGPDIRITAERFLTQPWSLVRQFEGQLAVADMPYLALGVTQEYLDQGLTPGFAVPVGPALLVICGEWFNRKFKQSGDVVREWNRVAVDRADRWLFARPGTVIEVPVLFSQQGGVNPMQVHLPLELKRLPRSTSRKR